MKALNEGRKGNIESTGGASLKRFTSKGPIQGHKEYTSPKIKSPEDPSMQTILEYIFKMPLEILGHKLFHLPLLLRTPRYKPLLPLLPLIPLRENK